VSRRALLAFGGGGIAAIGVAAAGGFVAGHEASGQGSSTQHAVAATTYPFTGEHQAGIVTPAQDRMYVAAFDLTTTSRAER
jgi:deferrochelatase/peroxidase EfeB